MLVYDLDLPTIAAQCDSWNEPEYRAMQIWQGLYHDLHNSWSEFLNLPKSLRQALQGWVTWEGMRPLTYRASADGRAHKTVFQLHDGLRIETVLMRYEKRHTVCISSQVGCAMGCVFCATGQMGFKRHLSSGEIVAQVMFYARKLRGEAHRITNIVIMGMGEPFHNYENTMAAIDQLAHPDGLAFGARRITVSTVGLVPMIRRFADERRQVNLAVSLHAADDELRASMLPINKRYDTAEVIDACRYYVSQTHRRVTFEWALVSGINDSPEQAGRLAARLKGLLCHVNAIPLNPTAGYAGHATSREAARLFRKVLEQAGVPCTIRLRRGIEIGAGCGQLAV